MQIIHDLAGLRSAVAALKADGQPVALVPTMGALHDGHLALVAEARRRTRHVVVSIFVNPMQFGPGEDLDAYPRRLNADAALLREAGATILWAPDAATMYPEGFASKISVSGLTEELDGAARPGHFDGVATVVTKLFYQVGADIACFGEKDYQQLATIRRMVRDLDVPIEIIGVPTQRAEDGLALSSRNAYLTEEERLAARALPRALGEAGRAIMDGGDIASALEKAVADLRKAGFGSVDYVELRDAETLLPVSALARPARLLAAARMGNTRLIDNIPLESPS